MDYEAAKAARGLLTALTDPSSADGGGAALLHPQRLAQLKAALRASEELVAYLTPLVMDRLAANNAAARRLALELCAVLFARSRCFRRLLTQQFSTLVDLVVGHRPDKPLPVPAAAAQALRARGLEVIQEWHEAWGLHYPQVTAAYRFLKKQYRFPDISTRAAAAAAEAAARRARHQQQLLQRYQAFRAREYPQQRGQLESLALQLQLCFELLAQQPQEQEQGQQQQQEPANGRPPGRELDGGGRGVPEPEPGPDVGQGDDDEGWEDVGAPVPPARPAAAAGAGAAAGGDAAAAAGAGGAAGCGAGGAAGGGSAAAAAVPPWGEEEELEELVGSFRDYQQAAATRLAAEELAARNASLLEQLRDLVRQAQLATAKPLLEWLRLLSQVQPPEPPARRQGQGQEQQEQERQQQQWQQERQRLLREVVQLRARLQDLVQQAAADWGVEVAAPAAAAAAAAGPAPAAGEQQQQEQAAGESPQPAASGQQQPAQAGAAGLDGGAEAAGRCNIDGLADLPSRGAARNGSSGGGGQQQGAAPPPASSGPQLTLGSGLQRLQAAQRQRQRQRRPAAAGAAGASDPYASLCDPTTAVGGRYVIPRDVIQRNERLRLFHSLPGADDGGNGGADGAAAAAPPSPPAVPQGSPPAPPAPPAAAASTAAASATSHQGVRGEVFGRLLAAAPKLPISGLDWVLAEHSVNQQHSLDLPNHWGPVDVARSVPRDRLGQIVGYAATYYNPRQRQQQQQQQPAGPAAPQPAAPGSAARGPAAPGAAPAPTAHPGQTGGEAGSQPVPRPAAGTAAAAAAASGSGGNQRRQRQQRQQEEEDEDARALELGGRQAAAAHNRAVLAGDFTDAGIAAALQRQLDEEAAAEAEEAAGAGGGGRKGRRPAERAGDKVRRKLLG